MGIGTGAGVYIEEGNIRESYRIPDEYGVFQVEIVAIIKAVYDLTNCI